MSESWNGAVPHAPHLFDAQTVLDAPDEPESAWLWSGLLPTGPRAIAEGPQARRGAARLEADLEWSLVDLYKVTLGAPPWHDEVPMTAEQLRLIADMSACEGLACRLERDLDVARSAWNLLREVVRRIHRRAPRRWELSPSAEGVLTDHAHRLRGWLVQELLAGGFVDRELPRKQAIRRAAKLAADLRRAAGAGPHAGRRWVLGALYYRVVLDARPAIPRRWEIRRWLRRGADRPWLLVPVPTPDLLEVLDEAATEAAGPPPSIDPEVDRMSRLIDVPDGVCSQVIGGIRVDLAYDASRAAVRVIPEDGSAEPCVISLSHERTYRLADTLGGYIARGCEPAEVTDNLQALVEAGEDAAALEVALTGLEQALR